MTDGAWQRTVHCKDALGRDRSLLVNLSLDGELVFRLPAGEAAVLDPGSGGDLLKTCISDAQRAAADLLLGRPPAHALTGTLRDATTFYVVDREERALSLGIGLNGTRVAFNGPRGFWQADDNVAGSIGGKVLALAQVARDLRRRS